MRHPYIRYTYRCSKRSITSENFIGFLLVGSVFGQFPIRSSDEFYLEVCFFFTPCWLVTPTTMAVITTAVSFILLQSPFIRSAQLLAPSLTRSLPRQKIAKEIIWMKHSNYRAFRLTESVPVSRQSDSFLVFVDLTRQFYHMFKRV